ncbi:MAG TPA: glucan biosynthesis protein [Lacunisphaera sp.]|jgi:glucans biosynthesis protein|nr:glucan biosynthesis protein [Lacunisphaera sp.]
MMNSFRIFRHGLAGLLVALASAGAVERVDVDHAYVERLAAKLAHSAYHAKSNQTPRFFREMNYDQYRHITFREGMTLWRDDGLPFQLQFYHPGYLFTQTVRINECSDTHAQPIPFNTALFDYHDLSIPMFSRWGLEFAGFRAMYPLNAADKWDEVISFLGASYYRALGRGQVYGASARGLAINAGGPAAEEFPAFVEYWIRKPVAGDKTLTVHALLDGPSVAGAYTFVVAPGVETTIDTHATLYFRQVGGTLGFAPVSSMFWFGENSAERFGDFRPEVHDSDGLLVAPGGDQRIWHPLTNPSGLIRTDVDAPALVGFGLLQRDQDYRDYQDLESRYERRPAIWTEPIGSWPPGRVRLVEMAAHDEYHDNITAFWTPRDPPPTEEKYELAWKQHWTSRPTFGGPPGWVTATRQTVRDGGAGRTKYVIDFDTHALAAVKSDTKLEPDVSVTGGAKVLHAQLFLNDDGTRRLVVQLQAPPGSAPVDIRASLRHENQTITETWANRWQP